MAERRRWSLGKRIGFGLARGAGDVSEMLLRNRMAEQAQARTGAMQEARDARTLGRQAIIQRQGQEFQQRKDVLKDLPDLVDKLGVDNAAQYIGLQLGQPGDELNLYPEAKDPLSGSSMTSPDDYGTGEVEREQAAGRGLTKTALTASQTPVRRRLEDVVGKEIEGATDAERVPSVSRILGLAQGVEPALTDQSPDIRDFVQRAQARSNAFKSKPTETVTGTNAQGQSYTQMLSREDLRNPVTTSPTAQEKGALEGQQGVAKEMVGLNDQRFQAIKAQREGQMKAIVEAMTRSGEVARAGEVEAARQRAGLAPDIVNAEVDKATRIGAASRQPTATEQRSSANWAPLINADAAAATLEEDGARIGPFSIYATGDSVAAPFLNRFVDPQTQNYLQTARDFISTFGLIRSGVAVPPSERDAFIASLFATESDNPQAVRQKQATRAVFLGSMQAMVGKDAATAARLLADAINNGQIPTSVLTHIQILPEISQHLAPLLTRVPQLNPDGTPKQPGQ